MCHHYPVFAFFVTKVTIAFKLTNMLVTGLYEPKHRATRQRANEQLKAKNKGLAGGLVRVGKS